MMRRLVLALILVTLSVPAMAQQPDWNFARKAWDSPFSYSGGVYLRRYEWHAIKVGLSGATTLGVHQTTRMPWWASATTGFVVTGVVPHALGLSLHKYPFNGRDVAFDAFLSAAPLLLWTGASGKTWQSRLLAGATLVAGYFSLAPWASP